MPFQKGRKLTDYSRVQRWIGKALRDRSFQYRKARAKGKEYLNVGCGANIFPQFCNCLLYTSPSPRDGLLSRMPSSA